MIDLHHIARRTGRTVEQVEREYPVVRTLEDPLTFGRELFSKGDGWLYPNIPIPPFQVQGLKMLTAGDEKVAWIWPRGHAKTTWKRIFYLNRAVYSRKRYIAVFTATEKNQKGWASALRAALTDPYAFPEFHHFLPYYFDGRDPITKANDEEIVLSNNVRIELRSAKGENRGLNMGQGRPDAVELDDIMPTEAATSDTIREKLTDTIMSVVRFIGSADAQIFANATIMHKDDYWCQVADGRIGGWTAQRLRACNAEFGDVLWPQRWTGDQLKSIYENEYVKAGRAHLFAREMWNDPATEATHPFAGVVFGMYKTVDVANCYRVVAIDHSAGTGGDDFAIVETAEDGAGLLHVLDAHLTNTINLPQKLAAVERFIRRRKPHVLVIGRSSESLTFIEVLYDFLRARDIHIGYRIETPNEVAEKNERMRAWLEPRYMSGTIVHPSIPSEWKQKLESSLRSLDVTTKRNYDDPIDALARCVEYSKRANPQTLLPMRPTEQRYAKIYDAMMGTPPPRPDGEEYETF